MAFCHAIMNNLLERFFKYISFETTSDEDSPETPSNPKEFELAKYLKEELETIGLSDIILTDNCYLYAMLPASRGMEDKSAIGLSLIWIPHLMQVDMM